MIGHLSVKQNVGREGSNIQWSSFMVVTVHDPVNSPIKHRCEWIFQMDSITSVTVASSPTVSSSRQPIAYQYNT